MALARRERRLLIVLGAIALAALAYFVLGVGRSKGTNAPPVTAAASPAPAGSGPVAPTPAPSPKSSKQQQPLVFSGRDPFSPLVDVNATPSTSSGTSASPTVSPAGNPGPGPTGSSTTIGGHTVVLVDIFTTSGVEKAQVEVDGTVYTVNEGGSFAGNFALVSISGTCADFTYGSQAFSLCLAGGK